jgi:hypothetical protein
MLAWVLGLGGPVAGVLVALVTVYVYKARLATARLDTATATHRADLAERERRGTEDLLAAKTGEWQAALHEQDSAHLDEVHRHEALVAYYRGRIAALEQDCDALPPDRVRAGLRELLSQGPALAGLPAPERRDPPGPAPVPH